MKQLGTGEKINSKIQPLYMIKLLRDSQYLDCIKYNQSTLIQLWGSSSSPYDLKKTFKGSDFKI